MIPDDPVPETIKRHALLEVSARPQYFMRLELDIAQLMNVCFALHHAKQGQSQDSRAMDARICDQIIQRLKDDGFANIAELIEYETYRKR
jgi:hypothetical protein